MVVVAGAQVGQLVADMKRVLHAAMQVYATGAAFARLDLGNLSQELVGVDQVAGRFSFIE